MSLAKLLAPVKLLTIFLVLIGAGVVTCIFQSLSHFVVRPLSLVKHRNLCTIFSHAFLLLGSFLLEYWANIKIVTYGEKISSATSALCILNHCSNVDWLIGLAWLSRFGFPFPGNAKAVVKASLGQVPIFGWILRLSEFLFLTRSWKEDQETFARDLLSLRTYKDIGSSLWVILFPEGSRLTKDKLLNSQRYARSKNLPVFRHVLLPRFKAFNAVIPVLRESLDVVCDATLMFEGPKPSLSTVMSGKADTTVHIHVTSFPMQEMPNTEEELQTWLLDRWRQKESLIEDFTNDKQSLGQPSDDYFAIRGRPSVMPLLALFSVFVFSTIPVLLLFSRIEHGLLYLVLMVSTIVVLTGLFVAVNLRPSQKGRTSTVTADAKSD